MLLIVCLCVRIVCLLIGISHTPSPPSLNRPLPWQYNVNLLCKREGRMEWNNRRIRSYFVESVCK